MKGVVLMMRVVLICLYYMAFYFTNLFSEKLYLIPTFIGIVLISYCYRSGLFAQMKRIHSNIFSYSLIPIVISCVTYFLLFYLLNLEKVSQSIQEMSMYEFMVSVSLIPVFEELVFRYLMINPKKKIRSSIISSFLFAIAHMPYLNIDLILFIQMFLLGLSLAYIYLKNDNISYSILGHVFYNAFISFIYLLV